MSSQRLQPCLTLTLNSVLLAIVLVAAYPVEAEYFSSPDGSHSIASLILMSGLLQKLSLNSDEPQHADAVSATEAIRPVIVISEYPVLSDPDNGVSVLSVKPARDGLFITKVALNESLAERLKLPLNNVPECYRNLSTYMLGHGKLKNTKESEALDEVLKKIVEAMLNEETGEQLEQLIVEMVTDEVVEDDDGIWTFPPPCIGIHQEFVNEEDWAETQRQFIAHRQDHPLVITFEDRSAISIKPVPGADIGMVRILKCKCQKYKKCLACFNIDKKISEAKAMKDKEDKPPKEGDDDGGADITGFERLTVK